MTKKGRKKLINNFLAPAVSLNPYFLLLFSRYSDLQIRFKSRKKSENIKKYKILQSGDFVFFFFLLEKSHRIKRKTEQCPTVP